MANPNPTEESLSRACAAFFQMIEFQKYPFTAFRENAPPIVAETEVNEPPLDDPVHFNHRIRLVHALDCILYEIAEDFLHLPGINVHRQQGGYLGADDHSNPGGSQVWSHPTNSNIQQVPYRRLLSPQGEHFGLQETELQQFVQ